MDNVLVVDDERNIRTLVARVLAPDQIEVQGAGTGSEGIQMADEMSPDLVLLDLRLPDMDGMDVLRTLKNRHPGVAVIIITGFGQIQSAVEAIKVGATPRSWRSTAPPSRRRSSRASCSATRRARLPTQSPPRRG